MGWCISLFTVLLGGVHYGNSRQQFTEKGEEVSRRDLIKKVAKGALSLGGIVVAGAAGGIGARNAEALFEKPPESIAQNPLQEIVDERYAIFSQAIDSGDSESVLLAIFWSKNTKKSLLKLQISHGAPRRP